MRGYYRPKADLKSFATPTMTREQLADAIAKGFPSPVEYAVQGGPLPVNLRRAVDEPDREELA